jgi:hypothetical protein
LNSAATARQQAKHVIESLGNLSRRQMRDTSRRKLDRQRNSVKAAANLDDRKTRFRTELEGRFDRLRPLDEQPD